jgi:hypothetical protein
LLIVFAASTLNFSYRLKKYNTAAITITKVLSLTFCSTCSVSALASSSPSTFERDAITARLEKHLFGLSIDVERHRLGRSMRGSSG